MEHPISTNYIDQQVARAAAALAAAGAWDAAPVEMGCPDFYFVTLFLSYTRGGAGGSFDFRVDVSPDGTTFYQTSIYAPGIVVPGADTGADVQREFVNYQATGAGAETFVYGPIELRGTVKEMRVVAREVGNVGAPGTLAVTAVFS